MVSLDSIVQLIQTYGLWLLFLLAIIEGPIVTVIAAYVAALGKLDVYAVYVVLVAADLVGDMIYYFIGRFAPGWLPRRWQAKLGINPERLHDLEQHFDGHGGKTLVIGKLTHSAGLFILMAAGASKMPPAKFLMFNLLGTLPKTLAFILVGYSLGYAYKTIDSYLFRASIIILVLVLVAALAWFLRKRRKP